MKEALEKIRSDYHRYTGKGSSRSAAIIVSITVSVSDSPTRRTGHVHAQKVVDKYSMDISRKCRIGYGLYLGHGICMVVSQHTVIGNNVNLSQFLNIGTNRGEGATIGDNVYIGPQACIVGKVHIGDCSNIGAGAVVVKDVPPGTTVGGVPARVISDQRQDFILNPYAPVRPGRN